MPHAYLQHLMTPRVRAAQARYYGRARPDPGPPSREPLDDRALAFIAARDSFYIATVSESGWPYMQHRGGPPGFLVALSATALAFADYGGNRQLITVGSLAAEPRVSLFLMDYAGRRRLKILGRAEVLDARAHPALVAAVTPVGGHAAEPERVVRIEVVACDWNCPQHIVPRFAPAEVAALLDPLRQRIATLEAELEAKGGPADG